MADFPEFASVACQVLAAFAPAVTAKRVDEPRPYFHVKRIGGGTDADGLTDTAILRVNVHARTHAEATELKRQSRVLAELTNTQVGAAFIDTSREITASQERPGPSLDERDETATFELSAREQ